MVEALFDGTPAASDYIMLPNGDVAFGGAAGPYLVVGRWKGDAVVNPTTTIPVATIRLNQALPFMCPILQQLPSPAMRVSHTDLSAWSAVDPQGFIYASFAYALANPNRTTEFDQLSAARRALPPQQTRMGALGPQPPGNQRAADWLVSVGQDPQFSLSQPDQSKPHIHWLKAKAANGNPVGTAYVEFDVNKDSFLVTSNDADTQSLLLKAVASRNYGTQRIVIWNSDPNVALQLQAEYLRANPTGIAYIADTEAEYNDTMTSGRPTPQQEAKFITARTANNQRLAQVEQQRQQDERVRNQQQAFNDTAAVANPQLRAGDLATIARRTADPVLLGQIEGHIHANNAAVLSAVVNNPVAGDPTLDARIAARRETYAGDLATIARRTPAGHAIHQLILDHPNANAAALDAVAAQNRGDARIEAIVYLRKNAATLLVGHVFPGPITPERINAAMVLLDPNSNNAHHNANFGFVELIAEIQRQQADAALGANNGTAANVLVQIANRAVDPILLRRILNHQNVNDAVRVAVARNPRTSPADLALMATNTNHVPLLTALTNATRGAQIDAAIVGNALTLPVDLVTIAGRADAALLHEITGHVLHDGVTDTAVVANALTLPADLVTIAGRADAALLHEITGHVLHDGVTDTAVVANALTLPADLVTIAGRADAVLLQNIARHAHPDVAVLTAVVKSQNFAGAGAQAQQAVLESLQAAQQQLLGDNLVQGPHQVNAPNLFVQQQGGQGVIEQQFLNHLNGLQQNNLPPQNNQHQDFYNYQVDLLKWQLQQNQPLQGNEGLRAVALVHARDRMIELWPDLQQQNANNLRL